MTVDRFAYTWTAERIEEARRMFCDEGKSARECAQIIGGVSRNGVIGILHRKGFARSEEAIRISGQVAGSIGARRQRKAAKAAPVPIDDGVSKPGRPINLAGPVGASQNLTIAHPAFRSLGCCKWPTSGEAVTGAAITFCCVATDAVYCTRHATDAYRSKPVLVRQKDERDLGRLLRRFA